MALFPLRRHQSSLQNSGPTLARLPPALPGVFAGLCALAVALAAPAAVPVRVALGALACLGALATAAAALHGATKRGGAREIEGAPAGVADAAPAVLFRADERGRMLWLNARWREAIDAPPEPEAWLEAVHPDDAATVERGFGEGVRSGQPFELELRLRARPSGFQSFLARACPLGEAGRAGWCGAFVDVDQRSRREAALQRADRRKDEFLAALGHELRNPLAAIRNALSITALRDATPEQTGAARRVVERQIAQMVRLIDDLLDVNRVIGGHVALRRQPLELAEALRSAVEARRAAAHDRRQTLTVEIPDEPVLALADRSRLEQVFVNLLANASKYSDRGAPIRVSLARDGDTAVVRFEDHGIGIEPEELARVFEPFVQLDPARAREDGGLGIGLTLVRQLVELHGGRVEAASEGRGRGTVFTVRLPALPRAVPDSAEPRRLYRSQPRAGTRRVLVVDDNADSAQSLATLLAIQGHEVRTAGDGVEALAAAESFGPEVVLLDIGMPRMDGYETARRLRSTQSGSRMLLLALTGWSHDEDRTRSREAGFDEHLVKPVDPELLGRVLLRAGVGRREAAQPL